MNSCPTCGEHNHPEVELCHLCGRPLGEKTIGSRSKRRFSAAIRSSALVTVAALVLLAVPGMQRHGGVNAADCALAKQAVELSFEALADQSAARLEAVRKLDVAAASWAALEAKHFPNKFSFSLPNGEHAWFEALMQDTETVSELLRIGEIAAAELAERELVWKLKLYPQVCD